MDVTGARNVFQSQKATIRAIFQKLDKQRCATCTQRIFRD